MSWKNWTAAAVLSMQLPATIMAKPADLPIDQRLNYAADGQEAPPIAPADQPSSPAAIRATEVFQRAERQQQRGRLIEARRGYEEVHLLAPTSRVGQQAIERLRDLESPGNDFAEAQEPPLNQNVNRPNFDTKRIKPTMQEYLDMLRLTQPLGTAPSEREAY